MRLFNLYAVAVELNKTPDEIRALDIEDFWMLSAMISMRNEANKNKLGG